MNPINKEIQDIVAYVPDISLASLAPFLILLLGGIVCLVADAASDKKGSRRILPPIAGVTLIAAIASFFLGLVPSRPFVEGAFYGDFFAQICCIVCLFAGLLMVILAPRLIERRNIPSGEFYTLIIFASLGMCLLAMSNELLTAFISLEIMSLSLYVLTGIDRRSGRAAEAAFKYFILGAFASALLVFGMAFLYGATQTTRLDLMGQVLASGYNTLITGETVAVNPVWIYLGFTLVFAGLCFKLTLAPFHMWAPDVYQGANTPTAMMIATGSKVAAFAFLIHLVTALSFWEPFAGSAAFIIGLVAIVSMIWGNLAALVQKDFKRMMAYSSVAHTGYMMVGVLVIVSLPALLQGDDLATATATVRQAIALYLGGYTIMNVLAFGLAYHLDGESNMEAYRGLFWRNPGAAFGMGIAMFSLVGIGFTPPTIGFMGKFYLFKEGVQYGFTAVVVIAVLASVVSAFYYLGLVTRMFMREPETGDGAVALCGTGAHQCGLFTSASFTRMYLIGAGILIFVLGLLPWLFIGVGQHLASGIAP